MKRRIVAGTIVAILVVGAALLLKPREQRPPAAQSVSRQVKWPDGKRLTYSVSWQAHTASQIAPDEGGVSSKALAMDSNVEGEIVLARSGATLALAYTRFDKFAFSMQGNEAPADLEQVQKVLGGQPAFLEIDGQGRIVSVAFPEGMPPTVSSALRSLAIQLGYVLGEGGEWTAQERNSLGEVRSRYRRQGRELSRQPEAMVSLEAIPGALEGKQEVHGGASIVVDEDGVPVSIDESVAVSYTRKAGQDPALKSSWTFTLHRTAEGVSDGRLERLAARAQAIPLSQPLQDPDRARRQDLRMSEGMSIESMLLAFDRFDGGAKHDRQFLVKAAAWLRLHPEDLPVLVAKFKQVGDRGRGLILDVLAETGTPGAQKAMRDSLSIPLAPKEFTSYVQRFSFVLAPDRQSLDFLTSKMRESTGAVVALGSASKRLRDQHDEAGAREVNERLRSELRSAKPEMRYAVVAALGNAARAESVPDLLAYSSDSDVRVRYEVASALRGIETPEARSGLLSLAVDKSSAVSQSAFGSLKQHQLDDSDWRDLQRIAEEFKSPPAADAKLVELVREKGPTRTEGRAILTAMLKRNKSPDDDLPGIIRGLLAAK